MASSIKKVLLIFDLNKTLFYAMRPSRAVTPLELEALRFAKPFVEEKNLKLYLRSGRNDLLDYLFLKNRDFFDVGIWSSQDKDTTASFCKIFFERYYRNLLFITATRREEYEGVKREFDINPLAIPRDLRLLYEKFPQFESHSTIVFSNFANSVETYRTNDVVLRQYDPNIIGTKFENDFSLHAVVKFLRGVRLFVEKRGMEDVRPILTSKSFNFLLDRITNTSLQYNEVR
eukprot:TRINITY_DN9767_c0_g1_i6.p1 TRINITY_DN9767_c0_g1~~TRINITY_DN9767_c0_g1_i6.p1  ORF type:complete len:231 (+),score=43.23 TRINITY_DN9767_c0_g1_i6:133-825(+)